MNPREPSETFEAARRRHLIEATIEALADVGFKAASLSQIAKRADVSTGLFAHYFGDKDGLLEATLRFMAGRLVQALRERLRAARTPRERLYAVPDCALADAEFERRTSAVWLAFWGQITHSSRYQRIQAMYQRRMLSNLKHDLRKLVPAGEVETSANMIAAVIDGVWVRSHAATHPSDGADARALVRHLIDRLLPDPPAAARPSRSLGASVSAPGPASPSERTARNRDSAVFAFAEAVGRQADALAQHEARISGQPAGRILALSLPRATEILRRTARALPCLAAAWIEHAPGVVEDRQPRTPPPLNIAGDPIAPLLGFIQGISEGLRTGRIALLDVRHPFTDLADALLHLATRAGLGESVGRLDEAGGAPAIAKTSQHLRGASIVCAGADLRHAARRIAEGHIPWAAGPDLGMTPVFVGYPTLPDLEAALAMASAAPGICTGVKPFDLIGFQDEDDLIARLDRRGTWDALGVFAESPRSARRLVIRLPAPVCVLGDYPAEEAAFLAGAVMPESSAIPGAQRIFWRGASFAQGCTPED